MSEDFVMMIAVIAGIVVAILITSIGSNNRGNNDDYYEW